MKEFNACPEYDGKKLMKEFREYGRRADLNELSEFLSPKMGNGNSKVVLKMVQKCAGNIEKASNPDHIQKLNKAEIEKELLEAYDLDNDKEIMWAEYNIFNNLLKKHPKNLRQIFRFFDKNHNWVI